MAIRIADHVRGGITHAGTVIPGSSRYGGLPDDPVQAAEQVFRRAEQAAAFTAKIATDAAEVRDRARAHLDQVKRSTG